MTENFSSASRMANELGGLDMQTPSGLNPWGIVSGSVRLNKGWPMEIAA